MTAAAAPVAISRARPPRWAPLAWVAWRQQRAVLAGVTALLAGLATYLLVAGLRMHHTYASVAACQPAGAAACHALALMFENGYYGTAQTISGVLQVIPVFTGVFAGGPLLAREFETGTFRFAWTQGCGRTRWAVTKLALSAAALAALAAAFSLEFSWYYRPFFTLRADSVLAPQIFGLRGVAFCAWTLAAFALGAFAGALIRRVVAALAVALAAWTGLALGTVLWLRGHYQRPVSTTRPPGGGGLPWVVRDWWEGPGGHPASLATVRNLAQQAPPQVQARDNGIGAWLGQHGYTHWVSYQPASRYWHFQLIEGSWLLVLALGLLALTVALVRRGD